jgi:hypothetical protein
MPVLECRSVVFLSEGDEAAFFRLLHENKAIRRIEGEGRSLYLHVRSHPSDRSLRDLLAIFHRYHISMRQLAQFASGANRSWFEVPGKYWYRRVFGGKRRDRTSNLALERTAGMRRSTRREATRVPRGRSAPGR